MSEAWQEKYRVVVQKHARQIVVDIYNGLRAENPLLNFCENARKCAATLRELLTEDIIQKWQSAFAAILTQIETTETKTEKLMTDAWASAH